MSKTLKHISLDWVWAIPNSQLVCGDKQTCGTGMALRVIYGNIHSFHNNKSYLLINWWMVKW